MVKRSWRRDYTRDIQKAKQTYDDVKSHIKEAPDGQIPLGDTGIYTSPNLQSNEPVSVFDCEQYHSSPYCGGNPLTLTFIGLEPDFGINECGAWVELNPVIGFTKLPPVSVGYRLPGKCREEEKPPQPPPPPEEDSRAVSPLKFPTTIDPLTKVFVVVGRVYYYNYFYFGGWAQLGNQWFRSGDPYFQKTVESVGLASVNFPSNELLPSYRPYAPTNQPVLMGAFGDAYLSIQGSNTTNNETSSYSVVGRNWISNDHLPPQPQFPNFKRFLGRDGKLVGNYFIAGIGGNIDDDISSFVLYGTLSEIKKDWEGWILDKNSSQKTNTGILASSSVVKAQWEVLYISRPDRDKYPPPPNQKRKKKCCMKCCNDGQQNRQAQDLAELLRIMRRVDKKLGDYPFKVTLFDADDNKVGAQKKTVTVASVSAGQKLIVEREEKNAKSIGIDHFPIYVPSSIVEDESNGILGDIGDLKNKIFKQRIESLAELQLWKTKNDYEIFGRWQEVIEVQDSDPNVKGNQPKRVVLPNMAKSFREIILLLTVLIKSQGFSLDATLKMYVDLAGVKTSTAATEAITRDIQDYLDYPTVTKTLSVPLGIKIPDENTPIEDREDIEEFLKNSKVKVVFDDWTGEGSIHDMLLVLLDAAARQIQKPHT